MATPIRENCLDENDRPNENAARVQAALDIKGCMCINRPGGRCKSRVVFDAVSGLITPTARTVCRTSRSTLRARKVTTTDAQMCTACTSSAMLGSLPAVVRAESREIVVPRMPSSMRWREEQQQPLQHQPTSDGVARRQPPHSLSQDASVCSASSHSEATVLATLGGCPGCEAPTVHLRTDSDGRVTMGL
jgi:hypothetical protein